MIQNLKYWDVRAKSKMFILGMEEMEEKYQEATKSEEAVHKVGVLCQY